MMVDHVRVSLKQHRGYFPVPEAFWKIHLGNSNIPLNYSEQFKMFAECDSHWVDLRASVAYRQLTWCWTGVQIWKSHCFPYPPSDLINPNPNQHLTGYAWDCHICVLDFWLCSFLLFIKNIFIKCKDYIQICKTSVKSVKLIS